MNGRTPVTSQITHYDIKMELEEPALSQQGSKLPSSFALTHTVMYINVTQNTHTHVGSQRIPLKSNLYSGQFAHTSTFVSVQTSIHVYLNTYRGTQGFYTYLHINAYIPKKTLAHTYAVTQAPWHIHINYIRICTLGTLYSVCLQGMCAHIHLSMHMGCMKMIHTCL